jgi:two-component system response regulator
MEVPFPVTILLVEDDPQEVSLVLREFERLRLRATFDVVSDGEEALDYLWFRRGHKNRSPRCAPNMVILDLNLPKVNGLKVLEEIKSRPETRHIPVIVLTSSGDPNDVVSSYKLGANGYVQKPVEFERFCEAVATIGRYWVRVNRLPPERVLSPFYNSLGVGP